MDDKISTCKQCSQVIARGLNSIECEGFCAGAYHASCVKMSYEEMVKYRQSHNMWWMCNSCSDKRVQQRNNRNLQPTDPKTSTPDANVIARIDEEIAALKQKVTEIHQSLAVNATVTPVCTTSNQPTASQSTAESSSSSSSSSSPSKKLPVIQSGTKATSSQNSIVEQRSENDRFWLFLTRIKNYVTEREVMKLVYEALGTDDVIVKKLVPAWKDACSMPFVSFKVGVNVRLKQSALLPSVWPCGLHFREFRHNYWEPL